MKLVYVLLALVFLKLVWLYKVYNSIPVVELKRRARQGDKRSERLYKVAAYQASLDTLIWLAGTASSAALLIWSARTNWWLAAIIVVTTAWLVTWAKFSAEGWSGRMAVFFAPAHSRFLSIIQPVIGPLSRLLPPGRKTSPPTTLYETRDLLDLLNRQAKQPGSRISPDDLRIASNALGFGEKSVGSVMTPRRDVKFVLANELVGPILVDELHKTGFSRFPVVKDSVKAASPQVVGALYLNDLIDYDGSGKVKDLMQPGASFINEDSSLHQALSAFLKTHHHLLIVVNSFEEIAGTLSLEATIEQILGKQITDEFDNYQNPRAVSGMHKPQTPKTTTKA